MDDTVVNPVESPFFQYLIRMGSKGTIGEKNEFHVPFQLGLPF
jgi:hypothetical protein